MALSRSAAGLGLLLASGLLGSARATGPAADAGPASPEPTVAPAEQAEPAPAEQPRAEQAQVEQAQAEQAQAQAEQAQAPTVEASPPARPPSGEAAHIEALEARIAEIEGRLRGGSPSEGPPSVSGRGVRVDPSEVVLDAVGLGGPVEVAGTVRGNAVGLGADVVVHDGAAVDGHAVALGGDVRVEPGASVTGRQLSLDVEEGAESALAIPVSGDLARFGRSMARRLALLLVFAAAGTLAVAMWPQQIDEVSARISDRPFWYGMAGAALTAGLGLGAVVMSITIIGLPIALLFLVVLSLAWLVGMAAVCRTAGRRLAFARQRGDTAAYLAGAALVAVLAMVPAVGTILALAIGFPAVGAAVVAGLSNERHRRDW